MKPILYYKNTTLVDLPGEIWIDAIGYDGIYSVSNLGRVRSEERRVNTAKGDRRVRARILSQGLANNKRLTVMLSLEGIAESIQVNQLIYYSFNPNKMDDTINCEVYHKNKIELDNRLINLGWNKVKGTSYKISIDLGNVTHLPDAQRTPQPYSYEHSVVVDKRVIIRKCKVCKELIPQEDYASYGTNTCNSCKYTRSLEIKGKTRKPKIVYTLKNIDTEVITVHEGANPKDSPVSKTLLRQYANTGKVCAPYRNKQIGSYLITKKLVSL